MNIITTRGSEPTMTLEGLENKYHYKPEEVNPQ